MGTSTLQLELPSITGATIIKTIDQWSAIVLNLERTPSSPEVRVALRLAEKTEDAWRDLYYGNNSLATDEDPHPHRILTRAEQVSKLARKAIEAIR